MNVEDEVAQNKNNLVRDKLSPNLRKVVNEHEYATNLAALTQQEIKEGTLS